MLDQSKLRVLCYGGKAKLKNIGESIKAKYHLGQNAVDVIPPAYSCNSEALVVLAISGKGQPKNDLTLFCKELTKERARNVALMINGDQAMADNIKAILTAAGTNVLSEVLFVQCPLFGSTAKPEELNGVYAWLERLDQIKK